MKIPPLLFASCLLSVTSIGQTLDSQHLLLDASYSGSSPYVFRDFHEAAAHFTDTTTLYIAPGVYWVDDPDQPEVVVGKDGREPFGITVKAGILHFIGLDTDACNVVLASQRGQTQGAVGNFTMFDFWCDSLFVENMTMGNYCNVDLDYPLNPALSRKKRNEAITQAHVGYVHGQYLWAKNVRFISRLNLNPLNGANTSYYEDCHFECTDDAMNGTAVYRHCTIDLYGQKPFWSTFGRGAMFIGCDFNVKTDNREMYFCKQGGPLTLIDCRYHAPTDSIYIGWTAYPQPWLRCYQQNFTLNGKPYLIGSRQPDNTVVLPDSIDLSRLETPPYVWLSRHEAEMQVGLQDTLKLYAHSDSGHPVCWTSLHGGETFLSDVYGDSVTVAFSCNQIGEPYEFPVVAYDGLALAVCQVGVKPAPLPAPAFTRQPQIRLQKGLATLDYELKLDGYEDKSLITWFRNGIPASVTHHTPQRTYLLTPADVGCEISASICPLHRRSEIGLPVQTVGVKITSKDVFDDNTLSTDFHDLPCGWQPLILEGFWTVDGYKPADTAEYPWDFDRSKPMWTYGEGFNGAVGKGLLQEQRGARLMYTPVQKDYGDMSLTLEVDPTKTAGQGFGSATGQYMDVCLKFDTRTLTGYGLRVIRTTKYAKAVDFLLVRYENGVITPISSAISATCYRTGCTISLKAVGSHLTAHVETKTPRPTDSTLPHVVDLAADIIPNSYGGIAIQHTGSSGGESTTMLHRLTAEWQ